MVLNYELCSCSTTLHSPVIQHKPLGTLRFVQPTSLLGIGRSGKAWCARQAVKQYFCSESFFCILPVDWMPMLLSKGGLLLCISALLLVVNANPVVDTDGDGIPDAFDGEPGVVASPDCLQDAGGYVEIANKSYTATENCMAEMRITTGVSVTVGSTASVTYQAPMPMLQLFPGFGVARVAECTGCGFRGAVYGRAHRLSLMWSGAPTGSRSISPHPRGSPRCISCRWER